jgi:acetyl esterase/lipase
MTMHDAEISVGPPPPFDPECVPALEDFIEILPPSLGPDAIPALREIHTHPAFRVSDEELLRGRSYTMEERTVPGPPGAPDVQLLVFTPTALDAPTAAIYHIHGGGMVGGTRRSHVSNMLDLAEPENMVVVSVEYRLAPEHPDPAPVEDCYAGLRWVAENAQELGIDPDRLVIGGFSAGGGLTAGVTLLARDRGGPRLLGQMVLWPMLDDRNNTPSSFQMLGVGMWDQISNQTGWDALLGDRAGGPDVSPYAAPARADDLSGLPPALIEVGSAETFRDEAVDYAMRIWRAGGVADLHVFGGAYHGYTMLAPDAAISRETVQVRGSWLYRLISTQR